MKKSIYLKFKELLNENPDRIALEDDHKKLSRRDLDNLANTIAHYIPKECDNVAVIMDHSVELIASILAILKLGKTFIPIETSFPVERVKYILQDTNCTCIITNPKYKSMVGDIEKVIVNEKMPIICSSEDNEVDLNEESLAYILYTSGSTGMPKGVCVTNKNVCSYVESFHAEFKLNENDVMLQYSVCTFDIFIEEVFTSLLSDIKLAVASDYNKKDMNNLLDFINIHKVSVISGFPYLLQEFNNLKELPESIKLMISGGDVLRKKYVDKIIDNVTVYNTYGPSETTVCASYYNCCEGECLENGTYPIGKPIKTSEIYILDEKNRELGNNEIGEICIGGQGVSQGYLNKKLLDNNNFIIFNGKRVYKSGDLGYILEDGNIAFLNRKDSQVMIKGKRVESSEIQNIIMKYPQIEQCYILAQKDENELSFLTAYISGENIKISKLKHFMKKYLTDYMIPEFFVLLKRLPRNKNGKVDVEKLPLVLKGK